MKRYSCCGLESLATGEPTCETMWGFQKVGKRVFDNILYFNHSIGDG